MLNVLSTAGASILAVGFVLPAIYLTYSCFFGEDATGQSVGREGAGVGDHVAAADRELPGDADRDDAGLRLHARGDPRCLTRPSPPRSVDDHEHHPALQHHFDTLEQQLHASQFGMWVFLVTEVLFFGGLFMAYILYRIWYPEMFVAASSQLNIPLGAFNTAVLIGSSLTMAFAVRSAQTGEPPRDAGVLAGRRR